MISWTTQQFLIVKNLYAIRELTISDGSGPEKSGQGRARALKSQARPWPGLSRFMNAGVLALTGLRILLYTAVKKLGFSGPSPKVGLRACTGLGPSPKVRPGPSEKHRPRAGPGLRPWLTTTYYTALLPMYLAMKIENGSPIIFSMKK